MTRILVTGANGFIGRHVLPLLCAAGFDVHAVCTRESTFPPEVSPHVADLLSCEQQRAVLREVRPSHLLHLAWHVPPGEFWTAMENVAWLRASLRLLENFGAAGGKRWVAAGTCAEYDWSTQGYWKETDPLGPSTLYGACKSSTQLTAIQMGRALHVDVAWGRIFSPYGPGEPEGRLIPSVICALMGERLARCTEGLQVRDFMFVEDVARAFELLVSGTFTGLVNIASGMTASVREVVTEIGRQMGRPELIAFGAIPTRTFEPPRLTANVERLRSLGFQPKYTIEQGLARTIEWWASNRRLEARSTPSDERI
jgi:nucleoside-diphosphate-sugar epimerase